MSDVTSEDARFKGGDTDRWLKLRTCNFMH